MFENAYGLVIGIGHYHNINPLYNTLADAQDIRDLLIHENYCAYVPAQVVHLLDEDATRAAIIRALDDLALRANAESTVFIFMACHGGRLESGSHAGQYILPVDADYTNGETISRTAISGELFTEKLRNIKSRKLLVILDCCHSGGIGQPRQADVPALKRGLSADFHAQLAAGQGRVIIGAADETEPAMEIQGDRNGLFTKHLLAGLRGQAGGNDTFIRIFELYDYVQGQVKKEVPEQHPLFKAVTRDNFPVALRLGGKRGTTHNNDRESNKPAGKTILTEDEIIKLFGKVERAEFDELLFRLRMPKHIRPSKELTQGERAMAVIEWAMDNPTIGLEGLYDKLQQVITSRR